MKTTVIFPADLQKQVLLEQRNQDKRLDVLLQLVEYIADEHLIDDPDAPHPEHIRLAYACVHEWHNEVLARLNESETEE